MADALGPQAFNPFSYEEPPVAAPRREAAPPAGLGFSASEIERAIEFLRKFDLDNPWKGMSARFESNYTPSYTVTPEAMLRPDANSSDDSLMDTAIKTARPTIVLSHPVLGSKTIAPAGRADPEAWKTKAAVAGGGVTASYAFAALAGFGVCWFFFRRAPSPAGALP